MAGLGGTSLIYELPSSVGRQYAGSHQDGLRMNFKVVADIQGAIDASLSLSVQYASDCVLLYRRSAALHAVIILQRQVPQP